MSDTFITINAIIIGSMLGNIIGTILIVMAFLWLSRNEK